MGAAVLPVVEGGQNQERAVGSPSREGQWGCSQVAGQSTEEASSLSGRSLSAPPHKLGKPGLPGGG